MAKNVFNPVEVIQDQNLAVLSVPSFASPVLPMVRLDDVNYHPIDALPLSEVDIMADAQNAQKEIEMLREAAEQQSHALLQDAEKKAQQILLDAQAQANKLVEDAQNQIQILQEKNHQQCEEALKEAQKTSEQIIDTSKEEAELLKQSVKLQAHEEGKQLGFEQGYAEAERLIHRLHAIIDHTIDKRSFILESLETQVLELAILMVRKVVKVISENDRNVVINNIVQALAKIKSRTDIVIRVNTADLDLATEHTDLFIKQMESQQKLIVAEDSTVEQGGCIIEMDFGELDARISTQLNEIEGRIRDILPATVRPRLTHN
jgi:flagellar assembly protein FliH